MHFLKRLLLEVTSPCWHEPLSVWKWSLIKLFFSPVLGVELGPCSKTKCWKKKNGTIQTLIVLVFQILTLLCKGYVGLCGFSEIQCLSGMVGNALKKWIYLKWPTGKVKSLCTRRDKKNQKELSSGKKPRADLEGFHLLITGGVYSTKKKREKPEWQKGQSEMHC